MIEITGILERRFSDTPYAYQKASSSVLADGLDAARQTRRVNLFHPDDSLPAADRAELADYVRSGFDRGHMTPSGDMPDPVAQQQSFSLANIVPQTAQLNCGVWERIESAVRTLVKRQGKHTS